MPIKNGGCRRHFFIQLFLSSSAEPSKPAQIRAEGAWWGQGPALASKEAAQSRTGGNDWLYRDFAGDSALAAKADLWD